MDIHKQKKAHIETSIRLSGSAFNRKALWKPF